MTGDEQEKIQEILNRVEGVRAPIYADFEIICPECLAHLYLYDPRNHMYRHETSPYNPCPCAGTKWQVEPPPIKIKRIE